MYKALALVVLAAVSVGYVAAMSPQERYCVGVAVNGGFRLATETKAPFEAAYALARVVYYVCKDAK